MVILWFLPTQQQPANIDMENIANKKSEQENPGVYFNTHIIMLLLGSES